MARDESDREDLVKEATAYSVRGESEIVGYEEPLFAGFRSNGNFSFYFGSDPVYQFDSLGRLRRAFVGGQLYRSEGEFLSTMRRVRNETETVLQRTDLSTGQCEMFQWAMHEAIRQLEQAIELGHYKAREIVGSEEVWIEKIRHGCHLVLSNQKFLAPRLVDRSS